MHEKFDKDLLRNTDASEPIDYNVRYDLPKPIYEFNSSKVRDALGMTANQNMKNPMISLFKLIGGLCLVFPIILLISICSGLGLKQK
jgi:hypothetical protein